jgi:hypothetical protein
MPRTPPALKRTWAEMEEYLRTEEVDRGGKKWVRCDRCNRLVACDVQTAFFTDHWSKDPEGDTILPCMQRAWQCAGVERQPASNSARTQDASPLAWIPTLQQQH